MVEKFPSLPEVMSRIEPKELDRALDAVFGTFHKLISIDPGQSWRQILHDAMAVIVEFMGASAATVRIHEPYLNQLISFGSYRFEEELRESAIPFEDTIAGMVITTQQGQAIEDIATDERYANKEVVKRGYRSMLAVPLVMERILAGEDDIHGAMQIYYPEGPRSFLKSEMRVAEMMAMRLGHVIARKRVLDMGRVNEKKEWLVEKIFSRVSMDKGIKMKELFRMMAEELTDILKIQNCSLFTVSPDGATAVLESGWPEEGSYHSVGKVFKIDEHPYLRVVTRQDHPLGDFQNERVYPAYLLIKDPVNSHLTTPSLRDFADEHDIDSILYIPLRIEGQVRHLLVFDALEKRGFFSDEEIEILTFFGKELTQAMEIERLDDILHDFKNPAIAIAGFARRVKRMLEDPTSDPNHMRGHMEIVINEGVRLQEMAMSLYPVSRPESLDLSRVVRRRFLINKEAIAQQRRTGIVLDSSDLAEGLEINTSRMALERVLDNLLNNATKAIPPEGGVLAVRSYSMGNMAKLEISNTGRIPPEDVAKIRSADGAGRGLNIVYRFVRTMGGEVDVEVLPNSTIFHILVPLANR